MTRKTASGETPRLSFRIHPDLVAALRKMAEDDRMDMTEFIESLIRQQAKLRKVPIGEQST